MERIGKGVERELSRSGSGQALALSHVTTAWPEAVGDAVARQAWPLRVGRDGTLHIATTSATWAFELDRLAPEIHSRLAALLGDEAPSALRFRVGPVPEPGSLDATESVPAPPPEASEKAAAEADSAAAAIDDPELRELVSRAARASLSRARSGRGF
jgi:hypothetical protein